MPKPVSVLLAGGLGNQLFQWAAGFAVSRRLGVPLRVETTGIERQEKSLSPRKYELGYFSIRGEKSRPRSINRVVAVAQKLGVPIQDVFRETGFRFDQRIEHVQPGTRLAGHFQSWRYFQNYESEIRETLVRGATPKPDSYHLRKELEGKSWIGVHVRRGDYLNFPEVFAVLESDYYARALGALDLSGTDEIVVFSENVEDAKALVPQGTIWADSTKVSHPGDVVMLLAQANHVVGANSSLSWWGAFLNEMRGARMIFPSRWFGPMGWPTDDLIPHTWTVL